MSFFICDKYKAKFDSIFQQVGKATNSIWKGEQWSKYVDALIYKTHIKGQKASVKIEFERSKTKAIIILNDGEILNCCFFCKEISFSRDKVESKIVKDFLERLEVDSLEDKINEILEKRKEREQHLTNLKYKNEVFKRMLPFDDKGYKNHLSAKLKSDFIIELDTVENRMEIRADTDLMVKICGKIAELLNQ
ncbi:hypothetical protein [Haemophilus sp. SZY H52]|uniref:hypothetical protein n=1 Tax=Haemophilus sp. SZY H52 TaxID=3042471 RepID=UPI0035169A6B